MKTQCVHGRVRGLNGLVWHASQHRWIRVPRKRIFFLNIFVFKTLVGVVLVSPFLVSSSGFDFIPFDLSLILCSLIWRFHSRNDLKFSSMFVTFHIFGQDGWTTTVNLTIHSVSIQKSWMRRIKSYLLNSLWFAWHKIGRWCSHYITPTFIRMRSTFAFTVADYHLSLLHHRSNR